MVRLIPRDQRFFELFVADAENLLAAARALESMVVDYDRLEERVAEIQALEKSGDRIGDEVSSRLGRAFITPFDRDDIHELVVHLDDVVDLIQESAETFLIYGIAQPTDETRRLAAILAAQAEELLDVIRRLEKRDDLASHLAQVHELEHEADGLSRAAVARLFRGDIEPLEVIKLQNLYRTLEEAIDAAEDAAEVIERIVAKSL